MVILELAVGSSFGGWIFQLYRGYVTKQFTYLFCFISPLRPRGTVVTGAKQPTYLVTADDVDTYLAIEVQPLDNRKRKVLLLPFAVSLYQTSMLPS